MALDPRIILGVRQPDVVGAFDRGAMAAQRENAVGDQNKLRQLFQEQGPGLAAGEQGAVNALARLDPGAAQGMMAQREQMDQRRQVARMQAEKYAASISAEQAAQEAAALQQGIMETMGAFRAGNVEAINGRFAELGIDPINSVDEYPFAIAPYAEALDALKKAMDVSAGPEEPAAVQTLRIRAQEAGLQPGTPEYQQFMQNAGRGGGFSMTLPDGTEVNLGGPVRTETNGRASLASDPNQTSVPRGTDFADATGASGFVSQLANTITDAMGLGLVDPNNERATQAMQNLEVRTMTGLADGVAGRPSNFLLEQFQRLTSTPNSIWQGEGRTRERLNQTRGMLEQAIMMNQDVLRTAETATLRSQANSNIARLSRLLSDYDTVIESFGAREQGGGSVQPWMTETDPATWTEEQKQQAERAWGLRND